MPNKNLSAIEKFIGRIPYRLALAGGWIDQPFVSKHNPHPPGSMVVVSLKPTFPWMDRCGIATSTRRVALKLWKNGLPTTRPLMDLVKQLYYAENKNKKNPSGSQDMIGLIFPGINRLDYDYQANGGVFPVHIETITDPATATWLESVIHVLPVYPRPTGYNPLQIKNLDPKWIHRLGETGKDCFQAIKEHDIKGLARSLNDSMKCWEKILPYIFYHPKITIDLIGLLRAYQKSYPGAAYSGCGGGYLLIVSEEPVPGTFKVDIRLQ